MVTMLKKKICLSDTTSAKTPPAKLLEHPSHLWLVNHLQSCHRHLSYISMSSKFLTGSKMSLNAFNVNVIVKDI